MGQATFEMPWIHKSLRAFSLEMWTQTGGAIFVSNHAVRVGSRFFAQSSRDGAMVWRGLQTFDSVRGVWRALNHQAVPDLSTEDVADVELPMNSVVC